MFLSVWNSEPDDTHHLENCVALNNQGAISDEDCTEQHSYLCEYTSTTGCIDGWTQSGTSCYLFSSQYDVSSWKAASATCANYQVSTTRPTYLARIETNQELVGIETSTKNWANEPNNLGGLQHCGLIYNNGRFGDESCDTLAYYVCKTQTTDAMPAMNKLGCPNNWLRAGHKCYKFNTGASHTWQESSDACHRTNSRLLQITTKDQKDWIQYITMRFRAFAFWSGLHFHPGDKTWYWTNEQKASMDLVRWNAEPNDFDGQEDCGLILQDGTFNDFSCFKPLPYICELQSEDAPCPSGWVPSPSEDDFSCYYISNTTQEVRATWYESRDLCQKLITNMDGYLLAINNQEELTFIVNLVKQRPTALGWWTGLNDLKTEGVWVYDTDFNNPVPAGLIPWNKEPNNSGGSDYCAVIYYGGRYNDVDCSMKAAYICETDAFRNSLGFLHRKCSSNERKLLKVGRGVSVEYGTFPNLAYPCINEEETLTGDFHTEEDVLTYTYTGLFANPDFSYGYIILAITVAMYIFESINSIHSTYDDLFIDVKNVCVKLEEEKKYPEMQLTYSLDEFIGISRKLFYYVIQTTRPFRKEIFVSLLKIGLIASVLYVSVVLLSDFQDFRRMSDLMQTAVTIFLCLLPKIIKSVCQVNETKWMMHRSLELKNAVHYYCRREMKKKRESKL
uniref:C-type mannose receptor 2 n=1 Tax=Magallana gigas TaxID=29159 RepID=K1QGT6_MAGGI